MSRPVPVFIAAVIPRTRGARAASRTGGAPASSRQCAGGGGGGASRSRARGGGAPGGARVALGLAHERVAEDLRPLGRRGVRVLAGGLRDGHGGAAVRDRGRRRGAPLQIG